MISVAVRIPPRVTPKRHYNSDKAIIIYDVSTMIVLRAGEINKQIWKFEFRRGCGIWQKWKCSDTQRFALHRSSCACVCVCVCVCMRVSVYFFPLLFFVLLFLFYIIFLWPFVWWMCLLGYQILRYSCPRKFEKSHYRCKSLSILAACIESIFTRNYSDRFTILKQKKSVVTI